MKNCTKCKQDKPYSEYTLDKSTQDGYYPQCKQCKNEKRRIKEKLIMERYAMLSQPTSNLLKQNGALFIDSEGIVKKKRCNACRDVKDINNFMKEESGEGGVRSSCRACYSSKRAKWSPNAKAHDVELLFEEVKKLEQKLNFVYLENAELVNKVKQTQIKLDELMEIVRVNTKNQVQLF